MTLSEFGDKNRLSRSSDHVVNIYKNSTSEEQPAEIAMVSQLFNYLENQDPAIVPTMSSNGVVRNSDVITEASFRPRTTTLESRACETDADERTDGNPAPFSASPMKPPAPMPRRRSTLINVNEPRTNRRRSTVVLRLDSTTFPVRHSGSISKDHNKNGGSTISHNNRRQEQYISRLFYEEEANDAKPTGRAIDMYSLTILKKLFKKLGIEDMYQLYSRRQFCSHMTASLLLLACYKFIILLVCGVYLTPTIAAHHKNDQSLRYLIGKCLSTGTMFAASVTFLLGARMQHIYDKWSGLMSVAFLSIYGLHCLADPWIEAAFYQSMVDPAPNLLHFIFTAYAMLPIGTSTSFIASMSLSVLSVTNQICVFVYAYQVIETNAKNGINPPRQPEKGVVNQVISLCLLSMAAIVIGVYLKVFCTELTYRQTFYNTRQFIETELMASVENEINKSVKEALIHKILPSYLVRDILQQIETMKQFQATGHHIRLRNQRQTVSRRHRSMIDPTGRSTIIMNEGKNSESDLSAGSLGESKLLKLNIQKHSNVTILFADIVRFVELTKTLTPNQLVETLHDLYTRFDHLAARFNCQRTKLIGDCYKCVSGLNGGTDRNSAVDAVWMGLHIAFEINNVAMSRNVPQLKMRIGVHSGFVFAGILGLKKWQFDVWSDDVDIANALETEGRPGYVHASEATVDNLPEGIFQLEPVIELPGLRGTRARDLLTRKNIQSYIVTCGTHLTLEAAINQFSARKNTVRRPTTGSDGLLSPHGTMLPMRVPSALSDYEMASNRSGSDSTNGFRRARQMVRRALHGDIFVTSASATMTSHACHSGTLTPNNGTLRIIPPETQRQSSGQALEEANVTFLPSGDNPIGNFISDTRQFSRQLQISPQEKESEINRRLQKVFVLDGASNSAANGDDLNTSTNLDRNRLKEIQSEMNSIAMTFKNLRLERVYKQHRDDPFQLAIVVSYLTFLIITAIIRLNKLEGANEAVTSSISSVTTLLLGLAVFFFTICGFSTKLMIRLRIFLRSNFARSVAYVSAMAVLYCNTFMPFYLCAPLDQKTLVTKLSNACNICDINDKEACKNVSPQLRSERRLLYPPIVNFEEAMTLNGTDRHGFCPDSYLFGDMTVLLVFVTAIFSRIPFLIRYLVIIIGNLVFIFFAFLLKPHAFTVYDLCAVQHLFSESELESKLYYTIFQFFFFLNLLVMCYQQEKNNRLDFLLRDGARKKEQELRKKLAQNTALLENILPSHVIQWYVTNESGTSELYINSHDRVCILFAKITNYTFEGESVEVMRALNEITAAFDNLLDLPEYSSVIEKIKINQTMFMYAAGLDSRDNRRFDEAAVTLLDFAAALFDTLQKLNEQISFPYKLRAGMHCGPVVAGVIGSSMPLYDILGDTVNIASRLESCHQDGFIHVSAQLNELYHVECGIDYYKRITVDIKGLGKRTVFIYVPETIIDFMKGIKQQLQPSKKA